MPRLPELWRGSDRRTRNVHSMRTAHRSKVTRASESEGQERNIHSLGLLGAP